MLRAVLLADLVDATAFIQRFGEVRAGALQRLDLQIRDLLEFTGGRLIDKADGLLAIFERPVQAVDFALRYQQALRQFSGLEGTQLRARVGIHVGELMTWRNTDEAVAAGAKPLEVEGLAKPVAARLMALALPGQILVSSMAQTLAQRAQAELGDRAQRLRWTVHGRYRFKGVPAPLLVHEVGEAGFAPLRPPPSGPKVWRELPFWRRPPVLAFELLIFMALGGAYAYTLLRSAPAVAFQERDWVVVGGLSNFTGDPRLAQALDTALRIGLEQSRYVNVLPAGKVQDALQRMGRPRQATIDRALGSEIALREGARVLLLPTLTDVGGQVRVSIEVVDPNTQGTVFAESAEGRGGASTLTSLDSVSAKVRGRLGESMRDISATGRPLAQVTTANMDALRAYSLATTAYQQSRDAEALALFEQALVMDPGFAMARLGIARIRVRNGEFAQARQTALAAADDASRLSPREAMELDTFIARFGPRAPALAKFKLWATLYPDSFKAYYGYSLVALGNNAYADALQFLTPALSAKNPAQGNAYYLQGAILLALNRYDDALAAFQRGEALGVGGDKLEIAETYAAQRNFAGATNALKLQTATGMAGHDARLRQDDPLFLFDQGRWQEARAALDALTETTRSHSQMQARALDGTRLGMDGYSGQLRPAQWRAYISEQVQQVRSDDPDQSSDALFPLLAGAWLAAHHGDLASARQALAVASAPALADGGAAALGMRSIVQAELALAERRPDQAIALLRARQDGSELYFSHAVLMRAYASKNELSAARAEARWLSVERGRAYAEMNTWDMWSASNIVESNLALLSSAEFAQRAGQPDQARLHLAAFLRAWPTAASIPFVQARLAPLRLALDPAARRARS